MPDIPGLQWWSALMGLLLILLLARNRMQYNEEVDTVWSGATGESPEEMPEYGTEGKTAEQAVAAIIEDLPCQAYGATTVLRRFLERRPVVAVSVCREVIYLSTLRLEEFYRISAGHSLFVGFFGSGYVPWYRFEIALVVPLGQHGSQMVLLILPKKRQRFLLAVIMHDEET